MFKIEIISLKDVKLNPWMQQVAVRCQLKTLRGTVA